MKITDTALRHHAPVYLLLGIILIAGIYCYGVLPREAAPDITIPYIFVTAPYEGVSPGDIETLITVPIERKLKGLSDVEEIRSSSSEGMSFISVEFKPDIAIETALQRVRDKVDEAKPDLPQDLDEPAIKEINLSEFPVIIVNLYGTEDLAMLKNLADSIKDDIESIKGVLAVTINGALEREIRVEFNPGKLNEYKLTVDDVLAAIREENVTIPLGSIDLGRGRFLIRVPGEFETPEEPYNLVVSTIGDKQIFLSDIASVTDTFKDVQSISRIDSQPSVSLTIQKRAGENVIYIVEAVKAYLKTFKYPRDISYVVTFDESKNIRMMVNDLENSILTGLLLVLCVIFLFMGMRNALFVSLAIPYSMLISFMILYTFDITLNMVVLFSLILALGMLVDNAIVIVENIYRHMTEKNRSPVQAASSAVTEVGWPVITSTLTTITAFFPMLFWPGIMGKFMSYLPKVVIFSLSASLFIALVVNPVLCARFFKQGKDKGAYRFNLKRGTGILLWYEKILDKALRNPWMTLMLAGGVLVISVTAFSLFGKGVEFFPSTDPQRATVSLELPEGTNIETTDVYAKKIEEFIKPYKEVKHFSTVVGAQAASGRDAFGGSGSSGSLNRATISIDFVDMEERETPSSVILNKIRKQCDGLYGVTIKIKGEEHGPPTGDPVNIEINGDEYTVLAGIMKDVKSVMADTPGVVDMRDDYVKGKPEFTVRFDRQKAALLGLSTARTATILKAVINGIKVGDYREGDDEYDITVRAEKEYRKDISSIMDIKINNKNGVPIPLSSFAHLEFENGFGRINRIDHRRVINVSSNVQDRLAPEVLADIRERLKGYPLQPGYSLNFTGENKEQEESAAFLKKAFLSAVFLIALVLVTQFNSFVLPFIILTSVLLSTGGVFLGLLITGKPFGIIMSGIGVISLAGVVVNNAIVLIDYINKLRAGGLSLRDAALQAGSVRFRPVILTAITTILGLIPMAAGISIDFKKFSLKTGSESAQWWGPMASAVIAGLAFATILTLVVVPTLYYLIEELRKNIKSPRITTATKKREKRAS